MTNTSNPQDANTTQDHATEMPAIHLPPPLKFGPFSITPQVFHISSSKLSYGLVNLKPILPGHTLICPVRSVARLSQLSARETSDLFLTVRRVSRTLERVYSADSLNVAVQDGVEAGQSVPHVHVHVIPRRRGDLDVRGGSDAVYDIMDGEEGNLGEAFWRMLRRRREREGEGEGKGTGGLDGEKQRRERGEEEMRAEAEWLRREMERDGEVEGDYDVGGNSS
ncbi:hypothetical protein R6Q59_009995 [Mikania micrantha]